MSFEKLTAREEAEAARLGIITEAADPERWRNLPGYGACTDPDTLTAAAGVELAERRRIEVERAAEAAQRDAAEVQAAADPAPAEAHGRPKRTRRKAPAA